VVAAATQGDEMAQDLLRREGEFLGMGLVNLLHLFSPERITLGGGVAQGMTWLEPHIHRIIATRAMPFYRDVPIQYAHHGERAGVIGAATLLFASVTR
jgi:glucokinase